MVLVNLMQYIIFQLDNRFYHHTTRPGMHYTWQPVFGYKCMIFKSGLYEVQVLNTRIKRSLKCVCVVPPATPPQSVRPTERKAGPAYELPPAAHAWDTELILKTIPKNTWLALKPRNIHKNTPKSIRKSQYAHYQVHVWSRYAHWPRDMQTQQRAGVWEETGETQEDSKPTHLENSDRMAFIKRFSKLLFRIKTISSTLCTYIILNVRTIFKPRHSVCLIYLSVVIIVLVCWSTLCFSAWRSHSKMCVFLPFRLSYFYQHTITNGVF